MRATIWIVRHGETQENKDKILQGQLDTELNEDGVEQAKRVADSLKSIPFDAVFSSDLSRATKTAEAILVHHPGVDLQQTEALRERYLGALQGSHYRSGITRQIFEDPSVEAKEAFVARSVNWWDTSILRYLSRQQARNTPYHILVVSHGGLIGTLISALLEQNRLRIAEGVFVRKCFNVSITRVEMDDNVTGTVVKYGDISHLVGKVIETNVDADP